MDTWADTESQRIVLWLIDGFGYDQVQQALDRHLMPHLQSLLVANRARMRPISSVYPSVTPVALASLLTGHWPGRHGLVGRYLHLSDAWPGVDTLNSGRLEAPLRLGEKTVDQLTRDQHIAYTSLIETRLLKGALTGLIHPDARVVDSIVSPLSLIPRIHAANSDPKPVPHLTYAYWPYLDAINHRRGMGSQDWREEVQSLDGLLGQLTRTAWSGPKPSWLWITADHGHHAVSDRLSYPALRARLPELPKIPLGTDRLIGFHLSDALAERVARISQELYGDRVTVITTRDLWDAGWMGPNAHEGYQERLGNWLLEAQGGAFWDIGDTDDGIKAGHGGRTTEELTVPWLEIRLD